MTDEQTISRQTYVTWMRSRQESLPMAVIYEEVKALVAQHPEIDWTEQATWSWWRKVYGDDARP